MTSPEQERINALVRVTEEALRAGSAVAALAPAVEGLELARRAGLARLELVFLERIGAARWLLGEHEAAVSAWASAGRLGDQLALGPGDPLASAWVAAVVNLGRSLAHRGDFARAREELGRLRVRSRLLGLAAAEMQADLELADVCQRMEDLDDALGYARQFAQAYAQSAAGGGLPPINPAEAAAVLGRVGFDFYYRREDFATAAELAALVVRVSPEDQDGYYLLSNAQVGLKKSEEALATLEAACARFPEKAFFHFNRAGTLVALDRIAEAVPPLDRAIQLRPADMKYRLTRARLLQALGRHGDAVSDFDEALRLAEAAAATPTPQGEAPRSQAEYERNTPARDVADFAALGRVQSLWALGRTPEALAACARLVAEGDEPTRAAAHDLAGEIHAEAGREAEALAAWSAALQTLPTLDSARDRRAALLAGLGRHEEALKDYAVLANRQRDPKRAIAGISRLLEARPDLPGAWRWRGFAQLEDWRPREAVEDLTRAVGQDAGDAEAFYWRGLAGITTAPEDDAWNKSFSWKSFLDALADLGTAVRLNPSAEAPLAAYRWVFDRLSGNEDVLALLVHRGDQDNGLYSVLPGVQEAMRHYYGGFASADQRRWREAVDHYRSCQAALLGAGLPVFACRVHANLADNYLRLYELQAALDHVEQAETLLQVVGQPLTSYLRPRADEISRTTWQRSGQRALAIEPDYMALYGIGVEEHTLMTRLLKAEALSRAGRPREAARALKPLRDFFRSSAGGRVVTSFRALSHLPMILRDAGAMRLALRVLRRLRPLAHGDQERMRFCNLLGTVWAKARDDDRALKWFRRAGAVARRLRSPLRIHVAINLARIYADRGETARALRLLDRLAPHLDRLAVRDRYSFNYLRARALWKAGRAAEARAPILAALDTAEQERGQLRAPETKIGFQARVEEVYGLAVRICLANGDRRTALELVERSRARAFLDQLHTAALPPPAGAEELRQIEQNLLEQLALLERVRLGVERLGPDFVDVDAVTDLAIKYEYKDLLEGEKGGPQRVAIAKVLENRESVAHRLSDLRQRQEDMRLAAGGSVVGPTLVFRECLELLTTVPASGDYPPPPGTSSRGAGSE